MYTPEKITARYVVGCDGAHSFIRKTIGASFDGSKFPGKFHIIECAVEWDRSPKHGVSSLFCPPHNLLLWLSITIYFPPPPYLSFSLPLTIIPGMVNPFSLRDLSSFWVYFCHLNIWQHHLTTLFPFLSLRPRPFCDPLLCSVCDRRVFSFSLLQNTGVYECSEGQRRDQQI